MSLSFFESIIDKLSSKDNGNSMLKNWTGSQSLLGSNMSFHDSIPYKYQEAQLEANDHSSSNLLMKRSPMESIMFPFHNSVSPNSLVSRVSKLFFPAALVFQDYRRIQDLNTNPLFCMNKINTAEDSIWEEFMQEAFNLAANISKYHSNYQKLSVNNMVKQANASDISNTVATICSSSSVKKVPNMVFDSSIETSPQVKNFTESKIIVEILTSSSTKEKGMKLKESNMVQATGSVCSATRKKKITVDNGTLNQELSNRKTKELQKRSKNRRRRQKKSCKNMKKDTLNINQKLSESDSASSLNSCDSQNGLSNCTTLKSATLCDVINITDNANSVQIILPNVSSFVITVDSAGDDSDWDENSDSEWLNDTLEFEFSGLNITNLPCSKPNTSHLSVPECHDEDVESLQLSMLLNRVNKEWNEATKDLDGKTRSSPKVSFVSDDKLVRVLPVEIYERKGEWEMYALERLRFKRKIDELDKIISPCLTEEHRNKYLQKYHSLDL